MAWTESRSRDDWLAEVRRRGERLRRRRRLTVVVVGALALVLPASALATFLGGEPPRDVRQLVAGPVPAGDVAPAPGPYVPSEPAPVVELATTTTTAEVHGRVAVINGGVAPSSPRTVPPADDPVVRLTTTTAPPEDSSSAVQRAPLAKTVPPATTEPGSRPCATSEVRISVEADGVSRPGEVSGFSILENTSKGACRLPTRAVPVYRILTDAGIDVSGAGAFTHLDNPPAVAPEPGQGVVSNFTWKRGDCTGPVCAQVPPGTYTIVADWTAIGPYVGSKAFQIGPS